MFWWKTPTLTLRLSCKKDFLLFHQFFPGPQSVSHRTFTKAIRELLTFGVHTSCFGKKKVSPKFFWVLFEVVFVSLLPFYSCTYSLVFSLNSPVRSNIEFGVEHTLIINISGHFGYNSSEDGTSQILSLKVSSGTMERRHTEFSYRNKKKMIFLQH